MFFISIIQTSYIIAIVLIVLGVTYKVCSKIKRKKSYDEVYSYLKRAYNEVEEGNDIYDYYVKDFDTIVKILFLNSSDELVVNSKYKWQINHNMRPGAIPSDSSMVSGIKNFVDVDKKKIVIIYKDCYNIKKYINECEMIFVDETTDCYGVNFIKFKNVK